MSLFNSVMLSSVEEPAEVVEEVIEEVLQYNTDDLYHILSECSDKLSYTNEKLDALQALGVEFLQLFRDSFFDSLAALLFMLVCFEILKLVRGWVKGVILNGRSR